MPRHFRASELACSLFAAVGFFAVVITAKASPTTDVRSATVFQVNWEMTWGKTASHIGDAGYQGGLLTEKQEQTISVGAAPWSEGYKLTLRNLTTDRIRPTVEYLLFAKDSTGGTWRFVGLVPLRTAAVNGAISFNTYRPALGYGRTPEGKSLYPETLLGVWIRIYDETGTLRQEWAYPWSLMTTEKWVDQASQGK